MDKFPIYIPAGSSGREGRDELMDLANVDNKALIEINGKKLVEYVLEAADKAEHVSEILLVGLSEQDLVGTYSKKIHYIPSVGSRMDTMINMVTYMDQQGYDLQKYIISLSADVPLITPEIIDRSVDNMMEKKENDQIEYDLFYPLIDTEVFDNAFPEATKRARKFKEGKFYTGDLMMFRPYVLQDEETLDAVEKIMGSRKTMARLLMKFDFFAPIKYMLGWLSLEKDIFAFLNHLLNVQVTYIQSDDPEQFIDLDYVDDYEFITNLVKQ